MKVTLQKILPILLAIILLSSCNTTKDLQKSVSKENLHTKTDTKTDRTISETIDTTIVIKKDSLIGSSENLETDPIILEDENLILTVTKDKKGITHAKTVKKDQSIHVEKKKLTTEHIDAKSKTESETFTKTKDLHKEVTGGLNLNFLWWLLLLLLIPIWKFRKVLF
jgi:hypothetical protein